jgi:plasmid stabilization system protein ParE
VNSPWRIPPYLLIYRHQGDTVTIIRVLHGAQDWP